MVNVFLGTFVEKFNAFYVFGLLWTDLIFMVFYGHNWFLWSFMDIFASRVFYGHFLYGILWTNFVFMVLYGYFLYGLLWTNLFFYGIL